MLPLPAGQEHLVLHHGQRAAHRPRGGAEVGLSTLFLLAHCDDEYFVSARLRREARQGAVDVVYTTSGSVHGVDPGTRNAESLRALAWLGVPRENVRFLGQELGVGDGQAMRHLEALWDALEARGRAARVVTLAWEGGHQDHDATHLLATALARRWGVSGELYEFPAYRGLGVKLPLFRTAALRQAGAGLVPERLGFLEALRLLLLCRFYASQWTSFLGLLPESFYRFVLRREQQLRRVDGVPCRSRPHPGTLLYEARFGVGYDDFQRAAAPFLERHLAA